jgi:hypothetical protein
MVRNRTDRLCDAVRRWDRHRESFTRTVYAERRRDRRFDGSGKARPTTREWT